MFNILNSIYKSLLVLAVLYLSVFCAPVNAQEEAQNVAVVLKSLDRVEIQKMDQENWAEVKAGDILSSGDKLRTGSPGSVAVIFVDDRSLLKLAEGTEVTFHATREGGTVSKRIWMDAGNLWAKVTKADKPHFEVETPTSVASVKGSEFYSHENGESGNTLHAISGRYSYKNEFGEVELVAGQTGKSDGNTPPSSKQTPTGEVPQFGGGLDGYEGAEGEGNHRTIRIEMVDDEGQIRWLVIPLIGPVEDE